MKMYEIPSIERPRERLSRYGPNKLANPELLAIILGTGSQGQNALELARKILTTFPDDTLPIATVLDLQETFGLGSTKASQIVAVFELGRRYYLERPQPSFVSARDVWLAVSDFARRKKEHFIAFYVDSRYHEIGREIVSVGTINMSIVHPREVFEPAIKILASGVVVVHNHPSGSLEPSAEDIALTEQLARAGKLLGIPLLDHVIVSKDDFFSFKEKSLL